ncbi:hypothetical protein H0H92_012840 [Tricholoma furcatifolium]|nr:hypothetical protein H0H92_012840 [Tricholoma furcatifolium]
MALSPDPSVMTDESEVMLQTEEEQIPTRTVSMALALLQSLKPQIDTILGSNALSAFGASDMQATEGKSTDNPLQLGFEIAFHSLDIIRPVKPAKPKSKAKVSQPTAGHNPGQVVDISSQTSSTARSSTSTIATSISTAAPIQQPSSPQIPTQEEGLGDQSGDVWADVLYLVPQETPVLRQVADLVHSTFKREGYITDTRPLKLHCTVLNTSKRRPSSARGQPFCYSDILKIGAPIFREPRPSISAPTTLIPNTDPRPSASRPSSGLRHPPPVAVTLRPEATVGARGVELWVMGSYAPDGSYVSLGGVPFMDARSEDS